IPPAPEPLDCERDAVRAERVGGGLPADASRLKPASAPHADVGSPAVEAKIREGHAPAVVVALAAGEQLTSEAGAMMFMSGDVAMDVEMPGGLVGGMKRALLAGESLFLAKYTARGAGVVGLCGPFPGSVRQH